MSTLILGMKSDSRLDFELNTGWQEIVVEESFNTTSSPSVVLTVHDTVIAKI